jgi:DNA-binding NtrC family response regulator
MERTSAGLSILLVDDDDMMLHMLPPHLEALEAPLPVSDVRTAQTPQAALDALESVPAGPLVVLSDFNLRSSMNGLDLLEEVAKRRPDAVRVLFSGYASDQIGDPTRSGAAHGFVEKPLRIHEMLPPLAAIIRANLVGA